MRVTPRAVFVDGREKELEGVEKNRSSMRVLNERKEASIIDGKILRSRWVHVEQRRLKSSNRVIKSRDAIQVKKAC